MAVELLLKEKLSARENDHGAGNEGQQLHEEAAQAHADHRGNGVEDAAEKIPCHLRRIANWQVCALML